MDENIHILTSKNVATSLGPPQELLRTNDTDFEDIHNASYLSSSTNSSESDIATEASTFPAGKGKDSDRFKSLILSMDRLSFIRLQLMKTKSIDVVTRLQNSTRPSTQKQQETAWKSLQTWLRTNDHKISENTLLQFLCHLKDNKHLETSTIMNYKAALQLPLSFIPGINLNGWSFQELGKALFLENPPKPRNIPKWDVSKVLNMLRNKNSYNSEADGYKILKKCLFLVALVSGRRVSQLSSREVEQE